MSIRLSFQKRFCRHHSRLLGSICAGLVLLILAPGCTALHPLRGIPAAYLPDQFEGPSRDNKRTIDLSLLVRTPPKEYRIEAGDVLSIYIPRVLGSRPTEVNSVGIEPPINLPSSIEDPPTIGYPITVRDDNTISLPQIPPLNVGGLTLHEIEEKIRHAYTVEHRILNPDEAMVLVSLQRPRIHRVLVVRQEANTTLTASSGPGSVNIGTTGKGTARVVTLKGYENDVLHALAEGQGGVDGLPGLNAENAIYIIRRRPRLKQDAFNCPQQPMFNSPQPQPQMPPEGMPPLQPVSQNNPSAMPATYSPAGRVQQISHSEPILNPPQYGSDRSLGHSVMTAGSSLSGHSAAGTIVPTQYNSMVGPELPIPPAPLSEGHSWGGIPPAGTNLPPGSNPGDLAPIPAEPVGDLPWGTMLSQFDPTIDNPNVIRIPIRIGPGEHPHITEDMITLEDGDIVFIDSRETEVFYTAGLLGGGQYTLPRDYDLGVLEAVSIAESRNQGTAGTGMSASMGGVSALNHDVTNSASRLAILRTLPNGKRITIEVDLRKAMRYQEENIRIQPGDILFLEYTLPEAICAFTQRYLLEGALFSLAASQFQSNR